MKTLEEELRLMANDIQIGGDTNFRHMAVLEQKGLLTKKQQRKARSLINRANRLIAALIDATDTMPEVEYKEP